MNKLFLFVLAFFATSIFFACNKTKTAEELLQDEKKATDRFIAENGFIITSDSAEMYNANVFFKTKEGLYIHVIDSGKGRNYKAQYNQEVLVRFTNITYFKDDTTKYLGNMSAASSPFTFRYGNPYSYSGLSCEGWRIGLSFVSENAVVNLIVPSALQPSSDQSSFSPIYIGWLKYRFK